MLACKYLADSALDALHCEETLPELRELDLSYGSLGHSALAGLLKHCSHLTHISLNGCVKLGALEWEVISQENTCKVLATENYGELQRDHIQSESIKSGYVLKNTIGSMGRDNSALESKTTASHALQQLNCVGCANIKRVVILDAAGFHDLSSLNFSLSSNLKEVRLECPYLVTLNLRSANLTIAF